jgi:anti-repressor protein
MTELTIFSYADQSVRSVLIDGVPWLVAADVTAILGYGGGARNAVARLPERMKGVEEINTPGGLQRMTVVNEAGANRLAMRSNLPDAEKFQDWLAEDVIPSIVRTGSYSALPPQPAFALPQTYTEALRELLASVEREEAKDARLAEVEPKAESWDTLAAANGDWAVGDAAKVLSRDPNITIGQQRLFTYMGELGWLFRGRGDNRWRVAQSQIETARLSEMPSSHFHPRTGELVLDPPQVRITTKGLHELHKRLGGREQLALTP